MLIVGGVNVGDMDASSCGARHLNKYANRAYHIQEYAIGVLQEASEGVLTSLFEDSVLCHIHAKWVALTILDMGLA